MSEHPVPADTYVDPFKPIYRTDVNLCVYYLFGGSEGYFRKSAFRLIGQVGTVGLAEAG
jgi:hypothetical protein